MTYKTSKAKLNSLSVFFPMHNEEKNVLPLIKSCLNILPKIAEKFEIILINDGSTDKTREIAENLARKYNSLRVVNQENLGYGGAVKRGFSESKNEWVFFSDADLQFDLKELKKFVDFSEDCDLIIGYRKNRADGFKRQTIATMLKIWNKIFLNFPFWIKDIDCAFKLIKRSAINGVGGLQSDGAMLSTEFLLKSIKKGYKIKQIGVTHYKRRFGNQTGSNPTVILKAVYETLKLRGMFVAKSFERALAR